MPDTIKRPIAAQDKSPNVIGGMVTIRVPGGGPVAQALGTETVHFDKVRHLASDKPLHRRGDKASQR